MTEHVHEFEINYEQTGWEIGHIVVECMWCPKTLKISEAEARLNATERLSAEDVRLLYVDIYELIVLHDNLKTMMCGDARGKLRAYADILEGKDG